MQAKSEFKNDYELLEVQPIETFNISAFWWDNGKLDNTETCGDNYDNLKEMNLNG